MNAIITSNQSMQGAVKATDVVSWLLSHGINAVTTEDLSGLIGVPMNQVRQRMAPLLQRGEMISPARGLWVPVPFEYRQWGAPEALQYIDFMMRHLGAEYYIGWMTAASLLGAGHHAPQVFQVAVSKAISNREIGRSDIRFYQRSNVGSLPTSRVKTQTGAVMVSTRAATMLSVANDTGLAAGLNNAANIIIELSEADEPFLQELSACAGLFPISALRRLGWILDNFAPENDLSQILEISRQSTVKSSKLSMHHSYSGRVDEKWSLDINMEVEPDV